MKTYLCFAALAVALFFPAASQALSPFPGGDDAAEIIALLLEHASTRPV